MRRSTGSSWLGPSYAAPSVQRTGKNYQLLGQPLLALSITSLSRHKNVRYRGKINFSSLVLYMLIIFHVWIHLLFRIILFAILLIVDPIKILTAE